MDWHTIVAVIAGLVQISSVIPYVRGMVNGAVRPNIVSWSVWTLLQVIAMAAQFSAGASWSVVLLIAMTFNTSLVLILAFSGYGYKKYGIVDWICLALALCAIALWQVTKEPVLAIALAASADFIAAIPTIIKTYKEPHSESASSWLIIIVAAALSLIASTKFDAANMIYPIYVIIGSSIVAGLAFFGQRLRPLSS